MLCTIIEYGNRKELLYGEHNLAGIPCIVYDVSEDKIKLIKECATNRIQEIINLIILTSPRGKTK